MADWEGVDGLHQPGAHLSRPLLLIFPLLVSPRLLVVEVDAAAPNTDQFVFPGEEKLFVMLLETLPGQTEGQQGDKVGN